MTYSIARLEEIPELETDRCPLRPVRHHFGITAFGVNAWTAKNAGDRVINEHAEDDDTDDHPQEELYVVTTGRATFELDGERREAPAGTFVYVPPGVKRTAFAEEAGTTILSIGGSPGVAYTPWGWEVWQPYAARYQAGEHEAIVDDVAALADSTDYPLLAYNAACLEALGGRNDAALAHLRSAVERFDGFREYARNDTDLDAVRDDPRFAEIVDG